MVMTCTAASFKDNGILVIPTVADSPLKLYSNKAASTEFHDRTFTLLSIASMAGCCQVSIPFGEDNGNPISLSLVVPHGSDKFLLDTILDMYSSLQEEVSIVSSKLQRTALEHYLLIRREAICGKDVHSSIKLNLHFLLHLEENIIKCGQRMLRNI